MRDQLKHLFVLFFCLLTTSIVAQTTPTITIHVTETQQHIDGFGIAEADWADDVFVFPKREEVIDALFGESGLRANILRGEIFPHYSNDSLHYDFATQTDTSMQVVHQAQTLEKNDLLRRGQYWLTSHVQQKYPHTLFTFSVWSPPAWMKQGNQATPNYPASQGSLKKSHYQAFADYLTAFYHAYKSIGVDTYAISPSNEPGYAAPWNSCEWSYDEMGDFIYHHLLPTFKKQHIPTKVQFGENPAWSTVFDRLKMISSADFCNDLLRKYPLDTERVIAAGHGYVLPDTLPLPAELRRTPIIPFVEAEKRNIPMWVTEISDITPLDVSMKDGLYWANMFHQYLMNAHVSAIVWWCGAQPTHTNESLIVLHRKSGEFTLSKRYDAFGHYTRYIDQGSRCVKNQTLNLPKEVVVSSFIKDNKLTVVVVNPTPQPIQCTLHVKEKKLNGVLKSYITTANTRWKEKEVKMGEDDAVEFPSQSIVTYVGYIH